MRIIVRIIAQYERTSNKFEEIGCEEEIAPKSVKLGVVVVNAQTVKNRNRCVNNK